VGSDLPQRDRSAAIVIAFFRHIRLPQVKVQREFPIADYLVHFLLTIA
jgi:hypothetical protein